MDQKQKKEPKKQEERTEPFGLFTWAELEEYELLPIEKKDLLKGHLFFGPFEDYPDDKVEYELARDVFDPWGKIFPSIPLRRRVDRDAYFRGEKFMIIMNDPLVRAYLDLRQKWIDQRKTREKLKQTIPKQSQCHEEIKKVAEALWETSGKKSVSSKKREVEFDTELVMFVTRLWLAFGSQPSQTGTMLEDQLWRIQNELREPMRERFNKKLGLPPDMDGERLTATLRLPLLEGLNIDEVVEDYFAKHPERRPNPTPPRRAVNPRVFDEEGKPYKRRLSKPNKPSSGTSGCKSPKKFSGNIQK